MPYKYAADGSIETQEVGGKKLPIFVHQDGKEAPLDGDSTVSTIGRLNGEAKGHRERAETAEKTLKTFDGLDPEKARKALDTVGRLDEKKLIDAGERDTAVAAAVKQRDEHFAPTVDENKKLKSELYGERIGGAFARSTFIAEKLAIPADMVQARFGSNFKLEDGKTVGYDGNGNKLFSRTRPGELADFDEAVEQLVESYPAKDHILKASGAGGTGARTSIANTGGAKTITRAEFDALPVAERAGALKGKTLVDA